MKLRWFLLVLLLVAILPLHHSYGTPTPAQTSNVYLSPVSFNATVGSSFTLHVMVNLAAGQNVSGFDIKLNYSNPQPNPVIRAQSLSYSGNIFGNNYVSQACVPGGSANPNIQCQTSDPTDSQPGWIHFSALPESGNPVTGPVTGLLFSVNFTVYQVKGSSLIHIFTANLANSGSGPYATTQFIPVTTEDAIFSNTGVNAFFNYRPTDTPSVVTGHRTIFNATGSFNADNSSIAITNYSWDFGDNSKKDSPTPIAVHIFNSTGSFEVKLTVTDAKGNIGLPTYRTVTVGPPLGALILAVFSLQKVAQQGVFVELINSSLSSPFENATTDSGGQVTFRNLSPGIYTIAFSGRYVTNSTITETIIAGWTTQDSVGIRVDTPPSPPPTPWYGGTIFLGSLAVALGIFGVGLYYRRRNTHRKLRADRAGLRKK